MKAIKCDNCGKFVKRGESLSVPNINFIPIGRNWIWGQFDLCPECWKVIESVILRMFKEGKPCEFVLVS